MNEWHDFQKLIWKFYKDNRRDMPWRSADISPYGVVVSEVMLQQTQVVRVKEKYEAWMKRWPSWRKLASASRAQVLREWQGLGYNRRAKYVHEMAKRVVSDFNGRLPSDPEVLKTLPGIGPGTAGSIVAFAFNKPVVFIETNIRRVYISHFFADRQNVDDAEILPLIERTLDRKNPREWYYALMDYGAYLKSSEQENPNRRSRHYTKQSKFEGSKRQIRGAIIRLLAERGARPEREVLSAVAEEVDVETGRVREILHDLLQEDMIVQTSRSSTLKLYE